MRFMLFMIPEAYKTDVPANFQPDADAIAKMGKFNEDMQRAGILVALDGLHPPISGARVSFADEKPKVTNGPFPGAKDVVGGYWIINVKSPEEAIGWATRVPAAKGDTIEVRRIFEMDEFSSNQGSD